MPQSNFNIPNEAGLAFRTDVNTALQAIATQSAASTAPSVTYPFQFWSDTSGANPILKVRSSDNASWLTVGDLSKDNLGIKSNYTGTTAPSSPLAGQFWIDTSTPANPILNIRSADNTAWVVLGTLASTTLGLLSRAGGTMTGPIVSSNTDYMKIPSGTTLQRPGSPSAGMIRYNSDNVAFEGYNGAAWASIGGGGFVVSSTQTISGGGTVTTTTTDNRQLRPVAGNAGPVSLSSTPFGSSGGWKDGTEICLVGTSDANSVIINFNDAAKGIVGNFSSIEIGLYKAVTCTYVANLDRWLILGGI